MGNSIVSPIDPSKQIHAITSTEYTASRQRPNGNDDENTEELQKAVNTFNVIISKLLSHHSQNQLMIQNDADDNIFKRSPVQHSQSAAQNRTKAFPYSRARSSSVGSSDEDNKIRYKNLYRKQSSFERNPPAALQNIDPFNGMIPSIFQPNQQQQPQAQVIPNFNNISNLYNIPEQKSMPIVPNNSNNNIANINNNITGNNLLGDSNPQNKPVINLPEILDESDEVTILRHLIQLLSLKVNKLNDEKKQLYQHISTLNQINYELINVIQQRFQK